MLDPALVRDRMDDVRAGLRSRGLAVDADLDRLAALEASRRQLIPEVEGLKREQNAAGEQVARAKREGQDVSAVLAANKSRGQQIKQLEQQLAMVEQERTALLLTLPNIPHASVPREPAPPTTARSVATASRGRSISNRRPTGISGRRWASWTSSARPACPARASRC
jgi:seryl-tRNA synthetase